MVLGDLYEEVVLPCRGVMTHMVELLHWMGQTKIRVSSA